MEENKIIVQLASPERKFTKVYNDFLRCKLLKAEEKVIFIILKSFIDFSKDMYGVQGEVFPTIETIQDITGWGKKKIIKIIKELVKKGIVKKVQRGLTKSNIYIISDYATMWNSETLEELKEVTENEGIKSFTPEEHIKALEKMGYSVQIKEKGLSSEPGKATQESTTKHNNYVIADESKSQEKYYPSQEKYSLEHIKIFFDYDIIISDGMANKDDVNSVFSILYDIMNTTKDTIRVLGEEKPAAVVIAKLMKLSYEDIVYAIEKYNEQTERIKNQQAYMLSILYKAKEQRSLDVSNQVQHDIANWKNDFDK